MKKRHIMLVVVSIKCFLSALILMFMVHKRYLDAQTEPANAPTWTHEAATVGDIVKSDNDTPTDPDLYNADGKTGLMVAASKGNLERVKMFLCQSDVPLSNCKVTNVNARSIFNQNAPEEQGNTALHYACQFGDNGDMQDTAFVDNGMLIVQALLKAGAQAQARNMLGDTPMHMVLDITDLCKRLTIVRMLMAAGADLNAQNFAGDTMAHKAVGRNDRSWLLLLMKAFGSKLNLNIKNNLGLTPAVMAGPDYYGFGDLATDLSGNTPSDAAVPFVVQKCLIDQAQ
jgi:ankyrin repeat protein